MNTFAGKGEDCMCEKKTGVLTIEELEAAAKAGAKTGAEVAQELLAQAEKKRLAGAKDRRLRNVKLLLEHYRVFKIYADEAVFSAEQARDYIDIEKLMWDPKNSEEQIVESIRRSAMVTKITIAHVDHALEVYKSVVEKMGNEVERRRYESLRMRWIDDPGMTAEEIATVHFVELRTAQDDLQKSTEMIAKMFFGIQWSFADLSIG
jgi:hypothetical protein